MNFPYEEELAITTKDIESEYGIALSSENIENIEFLSIDIANAEEKIGIEVDGPQHFVQVLDGNEVFEEEEHEDTGRAKRMGNKIGWLFGVNSARQVNGSTALKQRLLEDLGWRVGHIPFWQWKNPTDSEKERMCQDLLEELNQM